MEEQPFKQKGRVDTPVGLVERHRCPTCGLELDIKVLECPKDGTSLFNPMADDPQLQATYEFLGVVGAGGMGVIYKARHVVLKKIVAIKMIHSKLATDDAIRRFLIEGKAAGLLSDPGIIAVHNLNVTDSGQPYMVMDYVEGRTLSQVLQTEGSFSVERFLNIFIQVCSSLSHAHKRGVLHRDIKPSNIMLVFNDDGKEEVRIMDFGIAKLLDDTAYSAQQLTKTGEAMGSPLYMSPEQAHGQTVDQRSDIYSLGCTMYEALAGAPPFIGKTVYETMFRHMNDEPVGLAEASLGKVFPRQLEQIVLRTLAKDPEQRYPSMQDLRADLIAFQEKKFEQIKAPKGRTSTANANQGSRPSFLKLIGLPLLAISITLAACAYWMTAHPNANKPTVPPKESRVDTFGTKFPDLDQSGTAAMESEVQTQIKLRKKRLDVSLIALGTKIDDAALEPLRKATQDLTDLDVTSPQTQITDKGLDCIKHLKLTQLDLSGTGVSSLGPLKEIPTLESVWVKQTSLTREGLAVLAQLPKLKNLELAGTPISSDDLAVLAKAKSLKYLVLTDCHLDPTAVSHLRKVLPKCKIIFDFSSAATHYPDLIEAHERLKEGNWRAAEILFDKVLPKTAGDEGAQAECLEGKGDAALGLGKPALALKFYKTGLAILENSKDGAASASLQRMQLAMLLNKTAAQLEQKGAQQNVAEAVRLREKAVGILQTYKPRNELDANRLPERLADTYQAIMVDHLATADVTRADREYQFAVKTFQSIGRKENAAKCMMLYGDYWMNKAHYGLAYDYYSQALETLRSVPDKDLRPVMWLAAQTAYKFDRDAESEKLLIELIEQEPTSAEARRAQLKVLVDVSKRQHKDEQAAKYQAMIK